MNTQQLQALQVLVRERVSELDQSIVDYGGSITYHRERSTKDTPDGQDHYQNLNRLLNRRRTMRQQLRKWRSVAAALKVDLHNNDSGFVRVPSLAALGGLVGDNLDLGAGDERFALNA